MPKVIKSERTDGIKRIISVCADYGYFITPDDAERIWEKSSCYHADKWFCISFHTDKEIKDIILSHGIVEE